MAEKKPDVIADEELPAANILKGAELQGKFVEAKITAVGLYQLADTTARTLSVDVGNGQVKSFILNRSNTSELVQAFGKQTKDWVGKKVRLTAVARMNPKTGQQVQGILVLPA